MTEATVDKKGWRRLSPLGRFVASRVTGWQRDYLQRHAETLATLARLRRGVGKDVGSVPDLWQHTLEGLPGSEPPSDEPTVQEQAAYTALTLFAVHQQSRQKEMHLPGQSLGDAARVLRARAANGDAVRRRFEALGTAETFSETIHHARGLITQLRGQDIPLDYGALADDLVLLQRGAADRVRLQWGRDFYRQQAQTEENSAAETAPTDKEA